MSNPIQERRKVLDFAANDQRRGRVLDAGFGPARSRRDHELRNQLYLVISFSQLLESGQAGPVSASQKEMLGHVLECAEKIRQLLDADRAQRVNQPDADAPVHAGRQPRVASHAH